MKELIRFSLSRRFKNKATLLFNVLLFIMIGCIANADFILKVVYPRFYEQETIYTENIDETILAYLNDALSENYSFESLDRDRDAVVEEGSVVLSKEEDAYVLYSTYAVDETMVALIETQLTAYHQMQVVYASNEANQAVIEAYNQTVSIRNETTSEVDADSDKTNFIFLFATSIYFMMLSFVSSVAGEVVNEKATRTLELILTSVSAQVHFYSKLIVGWLVVILQGIGSLSYIVIWLLARSLLDGGKGLIELVNKLGIFTIEGNNFYTLFLHLDLTWSFFEKLGCTLLFLLIGILLVQLVLVIVSSFVMSVEEAGNLQAPFYLLLLAIYYLVIAINNPKDLTEGIGYVLSFVPLVNMLIMPCRLIVQDVPFIEIVLSASISLLIIVLLMRYGIKWYEKGVLDYSGKGFLKMMLLARSKKTKKQKKPRLLRIKKQEQEARTKA